MRQFILFLFVAALCISTGCSKDNKSNTAADADKTRLQTQSMDTFGLDLEQIDINHDGVIDQRIYTKNGELRYAVRDLNFDNIEDMREFYENGQHVRDEIDLDYDGNCDLIITYQNDVPIKKEFSIDFQSSHYGTQYYSSSQKTEVHLDTNSDGNMDTVEYYRPGEQEPYKTEKQ
ncbi:MAG: hypothetical protein IJM59_03585 [Proteobacteria bacterium]|jgi:antitoxin component YwqK of YwqJK toxin-antitoxin module|nr:hypothetical protein [Pseudomonadota bacterium]